MYKGYFDGFRLSLLLPLFLSFFVWSNAEELYDVALIENSLSCLLMNDVEDQSVNEVENWDCLKNGGSLFEQTGHVPFVVYTMPKGGSHLLATALFLMTGKRQVFFPERAIETKADCQFRSKRAVEMGGYMMAHEPFNDRIQGWWRELGYKTLYITRDPRDLCYSTAVWFQKGGGGFSSQGRENFVKMSLNEQMRWLMTRYIGEGIMRLYKRRRGFRYHPDVFAVRFEKLVGPLGGGSSQEQFDELKGIAKHIGLELTDEELLDIGEQLFGNKYSPTFHKGKIGKWREVFDEQTKQLAKKVFGSLLIEMGYEQDLDW